MAYQRLHPAGGTVTICCARDYIQEVFEISGYDKLFGMYETRDAALGSL
jgi:anti-sigma B factor antagonist